MAELPGLDAFLAQCRAEGLAVGPGEIGRLRHALALAPHLERDGLWALLVCTLAKDAGERERLGALFEDWCPADDEARLEAFRPRPARLIERVLPARPETMAAPAPVEAAEPDESWLAPETWMFLAVLVLATLGSGLAWWWWGGTEIVQPPDLPRPFCLVDWWRVPARPTPDCLAAWPNWQPLEILRDLPTNPAPEFWLWVPSLTVIPPPMDPRWAAGLVALAAAAFLWWRYQRRHALPEPLPPPGSGPDWLPLLPRAAAGPQLLGPAVLRSLIWRIAHFQSEDLTRRVDLPRTVAATARAGGLPVIHRQRAVYTREVWLWRDALSREPGIERLVEELAATLRRAGLAVRLGSFADVPEQVVWEEGGEFSPLVLEGHRQHALVAILSDGEGFDIHWRSALDQRYLANLLRGLGEWPHLAVVDFGRGRHGLAEIIGRFGIECIAPEALAAFLAGEPAPRALVPVGGPLGGEFRAWAAACALSPDPVDEVTALELRRRLGLALSPWRFRELARAAGERGGRLYWSGSARVGLLNWLAQAERVEAAGGLRDRALDFWLAWLRAERGRRLEQERAAGSLAPWSASPAARRLTLETALLVLWRDPATAAGSLYGLWGGGLRDEIRARLGKFAAADLYRPGVGRDLVFLPWRWWELPETVRFELSAMGFGGGLLPRAVGLGMPRELATAAGFCAGLGVVALGLWGYGLVASGEVPVIEVAREIYDDPVFREQTLRVMGVDDSGGYRVRVGGPRALFEETVPGDARLGLDWSWEARENVVVLGEGEAELWRAGTLPAAIRGCGEGWPRRSLVVIGGDPDDLGARALAVRMLDRGSADVVLLARDWAPYLGHLAPGGGHGEDQLLVLVEEGDPAAVAFPGAFAVLRVGDFGRLAVEGFEFPGNRTAADAWGEGAAGYAVQAQVAASPLAEAVDGDPTAVLVRGGPAVERDERSGIEFVEVCGGTFTMGSGDEDEMADDDETPAHPVMLSTFWIARTETTEWQYEGIPQPVDRGGKPLGGDVPQANVDWNEARAFCQRFEYELPTEAQWEYAARGGTVTRYSFGDDPADLGEYAWYGEGLEGRARPVGEKLPNPLGLHDMHGNVWEWNLDRFGSYPADLQIDPGGPADGSFRLLRGGSAWFRPEGLRSSVRDWRWPVDRLGNDGFRCVRAPRRQS